MENQMKQCQSCKNSFVIESEDFDFYAKIAVPAPTFCVDCRSVQRFATRNVKSLYRRECDSCHKVVISRFSINNPATMYCKDCWWGESWDGTDYGMEYDFSKPFFEQFYKLLNKVPHSATLNTKMLNSDYCNMESEDKNCYLTFGGHYNEECLYTEYSIHGKEVMDAYWSFNCEQLYETLITEKCFRTLYSEQCYDCLDTYFSYDCHNCSNVFGCAGLRNKSYCIFNKQYSREDYLQFIKDANLASYRMVQNFLKKTKEFWNTIPHKSAIIHQSNNVTGNYIANSNNSKNIWQSDAVENLKNAYITAWSKDCQDETSAGGNELCYMTGHGGGLYNCAFIMYSFNTDMQSSKHTLNSQYGYTILNSSDTFGCVSLRNKKYCILNKQYTKEQYDELLPKIKQHMNDMPYLSPVNGFVYKYGDFFPNEYSLFSYNESVAQNFYPKTKEEVERLGFIWREEIENEYNFTEYIIPDNINEVGDEIINQVLKCEQSGKAYRITEQELDFYRKMNIPIPHIAPMERIKNRINKLLPFKLFDRTCQCMGKNDGIYNNTGTHFHEENPCGKVIQTPYNPDSPELIYCEDCYKQEMI